MIIYTKKFEKAIFIVQQSEYLVKKQKKERMRKKEKNRNKVF